MSDDDLTISKENARFMLESMYFMQKWITGLSYHYMTEDSEEVREFLALRITEFTDGQQEINKKHGRA